MKLYYAPGTCALATHIVLEWIGQPYELEQVGIHPKTPELLAVNPLGAVPVLDDDGFVLTQNAGILNYLAGKYPEAQLGGDGSVRSHAEVDRWVGMLNSDVHPSFKPLFGATAYLEDDAAIEKTKENARQSLLKYYKILDEQLAGRDWLAGQRSVADAYLFITLRWAKVMQIDLGELTHLQQFFNRMQDDPAVQKALEKEGLK